MCSTPATRRCEPKLLSDGDDPLGGVLGEVADPLRDRWRCGSPPRSRGGRGHRLAPRDHQDRAFLDLALQAIDAGVAGDDPLGERRRRGGQRGDRVGDLLLGEAAHLGDLLGEVVQLVVVGADGVFGTHCRSPPAGISRSGR